MAAQLPITALIAQTEARPPRVFQQAAALLDATHPVAHVPFWQYLGLKLLQPFERNRYYDGPELDARKFLTQLRAQCPTFGLAAYARELQDAGQSTRGLVEWQPPYTPSARVSVLRLPLPIQDDLYGWTAIVHDALCAPVAAAKMPVWEALGQQLYAEYGRGSAFPAHDFTRFGMGLHQESYLTWLAAEPVNYTLRDLAKVMHTAQHPAAVAALAYLCGYDAATDPTPAAPVAATRTAFVPIGSGRPALVNVLSIPKATDPAYHDILSCRHALQRRAPTGQLLYEAIAGRLHQEHGLGAFVANAFSFSGMINVDGLLQLFSAHPFKYGVWQLLTDYLQAGICEPWMAVIAARHGVSVPEALTQSVPPPPSASRPSVVTPLQALVQQAAATAAVDVAAVTERLAKVGWDGASILGIAYEQLRDESGLKGPALAALAAAIAKKKAALAS